MKSHIIRLLACIGLLFISVLPCQAVRYHCSEDSLRVVSLLEAASKGDSFEQRLISAARFLKNTPQGKAADNDSLGTIMIRLDTLTPPEFIYMTLAAAKATLNREAELKDFEKALEDISRKKGKDEGFVTRFFYGADWIQDNLNRGNLKEMTEYLDGGSYKTKSFDYVSRHRDEFPALADSATYDKIRSMEMGFRGHRIPHQKKQSIGSAAVKELLHPGDIIIMLAPENDADIYDIGLVAIENDQPRLIHFSRTEGKVIEDNYDVKRLFKIEGQFFYGYRWLRPLE